MVVLMIFAALWHTVVQILVKKTTCIVFANKKGAVQSLSLHFSKRLFLGLEPPHSFC
jgi:hypothetical protein